MPVFFRCPPWLLRTWKQLTLLLEMAMSTLVSGGLGDEISTYSVSCRNVKKQKSRCLATCLQPVDPQTLAPDVLPTSSPPTTILPTSLHHKAASPPPYSLLSLTAALTFY